MKLFDSLFQAVHAGFAVDTSVYPWVAYKGPRAEPTEMAEVIAGHYTDPSDGDGSLSLLELLSTQQQLQERMGQPTGFGEAGAKESLLHAIVETVEAMQELNFKPWKAKKFEVDHSKLATELTDILQFWANAANAMELTAADLTNALRAKWLINHRRIDSGEVKEAQP